MDAATLRDHYAKYADKLLSQGEQPELASLVFVPANAAAVRDFCAKDGRPKVDYLIPVLREEVGLT